MNYQNYVTWGVAKEVAESYGAELNQHIAYVQEAAKKLDVPFQQIVTHDLSKWTKDEFPGYANHFHGGGDPDGFTASWLHHVHNNPHHWQHWIFPDNFSPKGSQVEDGCVYMPEHYVLEMVADWMGASRVYTNSWDMKDWLHKNLPKVRLHSRSRAYLMEVLRKLGY